MRTSLAIGIMTLVLAACGGGSSSVSGGTSLAELAPLFTGIEAIERQQDGSYLLTWIPLESTEAIYGVYSAAEGVDFHFDVPDATVTGSAFKYKPLNPLTEGSRCFVVRVANAETDLNKKSLCTKSVPASFSGIDAAELQGDGTYLLRWKKIPADDASYFVFEKRGSEAYDFSKAAYVVSQDFLKSEVIARGVQYCWIVRVAQKDFPEDANAREICSTAEEPIDFTGLKPIDFQHNVGSRGDCASAASATCTPYVKMEWVEPTVSGIEGYNIYGDANFSEKLLFVPKGTSWVELTRGNVPNLMFRRYTFGVKAVDSYGREDANARAIPVDFSDLAPN